MSELDLVRSSHERTGAYAYRTGQLTYCVKALLKILDNHPGTRLSPIERTTVAHVRQIAAESVTADDPIPTNQTAARADIEATASQEES